MRIIGGKYGRRRFNVPKNFKSRPTTDMAKENLFNILENRLNWSETHALDLFAGTGSIGFEMLSRGAKSVLAVELEYSHTAFIKQVAAELQDSAYRLIRKDVFRFLKDQTELPHEQKIQFNLIFADPPYYMKNFEEIPHLILKSGILAPDGLLVVEHSKSNDFSHIPEFEGHRHYGSVFFSLFKCSRKADD